MDLVQKSLLGQIITTGAPLYECMERILKGDAKAKFLKQANLVGRHIAASFTMAMATSYDCTDLPYLATLVMIKDNICKGT